MKSPQKRPLWRRLHETDPIRFLHVHSSGFLFVTATHDQVKLWDHDGNILHSLSNNNASIRTVAFDPHGREVFIFLPKSIRVWDLALGRVREHAMRVRTFVLPPHGPALALTTSEGSFIVWNLLTGERFRVLQGGDFATKCVAFSKNADRLIAVDQQNVLHVWDMNTGRLQGRWPATIHCPSNLPLLEIALIPQGNLLLSATIGGLHAWDYERAEPAWTAEGPSPRLSHHVIQPNGERALLCCDNGSIEAWDLARGKRLQSIPELRAHELLGAWLPDGRRFVVRDANRTRFHVRDVETMTNVVVSSQSHTAPIRWLVPHPNGKQLLTATDNEPVVIWDLETGGPVSRFGDSPVSHVLDGDPVSPLVNCFDEVLAQLDDLARDISNVTRLDSTRKEQRKDELHWIYEFRTRVAQFDTSADADPRDVLHRLYTLVTELATRQDLVAPQMTLRMLEDVWQGQARTLSSPPLVPRPGSAKTLFERLSEYISPYDADWSTRVRGCSDSEIVRYAVLAGVGDSVDLLPATYVAFARAMGVDNGGLFGFHGKFRIHTDLARIRQYYRNEQRFSPPEDNGRLPVVGLHITSDQLSLDLRTPTPNPPVVDS